MIEKRLALSPAPTFGTQYGPPLIYNEHSGGYSETRVGFGSRVPGQVMNVHSNSIHPTFAPAIRNQSPFSSVPMPIPPYKEQHSNLAGQPTIGANANGPVLTRQPSTQSSSDDHSRQAPVSPPLPKETAPANDYVDLNRSSVSPFQAAQYLEISKRLNTEVPQGLQGPDADRDLPPLPPKSGDIRPFADPESAPPSPEARFAINHRNLNPSPRPKSGESISSAVSNTLDFPVPPLPAYTVSSRYRVDSPPPMLPEINIGSRASMTRYSGFRNTATVAAGRRPPGVTNQTFPTSLSPLASSFEIPSITNVEETSFSAAVSAAYSSAAQPASTTAPPASTAAPPASITALPASFAAPPASTAAPAVPIEQKRATIFSMYDPEDAYGGI